MATTIRQAVILAAGLGSRLRSDEQPLPKPLVYFGGVPLLKRTILTAHRAGVDRFVIVVGCQGDEVRSAIDGDPDLANVELVWVRNPDYELSNGVSVLAAAPHVEGEFFLSMSDHALDVEIFETLQSTPSRDGVVLAVDYKLDTIFDMDDATKVKVARRSGGDAIADIGKTIPAYDAVDTGVFRCGSSLFDALRVVYEHRGDTSLSDGIVALAARGRAFVADVGEAWWQDVDTADTHVHGEGVLFAGLDNPYDGPISRRINRRLSRWVTRRLMNSPIRPNHMTAFTLLVALAAAAVTAMAAPGQAWLLVVGGLLYQMASMLEGVDGELARLRMQDTRFGAWFDMVADDVANLSYQIALGYALFRLSGEVVWMHLSLATAILGGVVAGALYRRLWAQGGAHPLEARWSFQQENTRGVFGRFCDRLAYVARREFYALALMVLAITGWLKLAVVAGFVTVTFVFAQWCVTAVSSQVASEPRRERIRAAR